MVTKKAPAKKTATAAAKKSSALPAKKTAAIKKMTKSELIRLLADKMELTTKQCATFFDILAETAIRRMDRILGSERLTGALLDRLTHHAHILEMNGDSYRLKQSKRKREPPSGS